jgi:RNA recognition motif-containing protein
MNIYVGNMSSGTGEEDIRKAFEAHGAVSSVIIIKDKISGKPKGFGFVKMSSDEEGHAAISALNGKNLMGNTLNVNVARPRPDDGRGNR